MDKQKEEFIEAELKCSRCNSRNVYKTIKTQKLRCRRCGFAEIE
jgi:DNA-directed RNA polymerase subunit RPC12/RpoP